MNKKWRAYLKPFLIIFGIYCFAMLAIWLAGVSYADDAGRAITGKGWTSDFNRYSSSLLSFFLIQMRFSLVDISPLGQILAMGLLTISTLILVELFGDKKEAFSSDRRHFSWAHAFYAQPLALQIRCPVYGARSLSLRTAFCGQVQALLAFYVVFIL